MAAVKQMDPEVPNINHLEKDVSNMKNYFAMTPRQRSLLITTFGIALCFSISSPTPASTEPGWWGGNWTFNIDGRPAQMKWSAVDDSEITVVMMVAFVALPLAPAGRAVFQTMARPGCR